MAKHGKKYRAAVLKKPSNELGADVAFKDVKDLSYAKFDESVDVSINLGIDASKGEQTVRGSVVLPYSKGKEKIVIVFAKGEYADAAKKAGADFVGMEDLIEKVQGGWLDFDYAVATPDVMGAVGVLAKVLGPRGLLPNKKVGTVTFDVESIVTDLKKGRAFFRNDKQGIIHFSIGKVSFDVKKLHENLDALVKAVVAAKPATAKGKYLKKMTVSSTMGIGILINPDEFVRSL
ncbi:MAG TPA: 50S ribosomal protein L1 [Candidatus Babeliales bacterium]|jgi:large subunit ribosomal protein L1|nr:50S ribosomal protein L1 [Candidatus Babeliales bacterium]